MAAPARLRLPAPLIGAATLSAFCAGPGRAEEFRWSMEVWQNGIEPVADGRFEIGTASGEYEAGTAGDPSRGACDVWLGNHGGPVLLRQHAEDGIRNDGAFPLGPGAEHHLNATPGPGRPVPVTWTVRDGPATTIIAFEIGTAGAPGEASERCTIRGTVHGSFENRHGSEADPAVPGG